MFRVVLERFGLPLPDCSEPTFCSDWSRGSQISASSPSSLLDGDSPVAVKNQWPKVMVLLAKPAGT